MKPDFSRRDRKGQSAIEYLTTYGWALLAIVIVGAVLMQMGVFSQCTTTQPRFSGGQLQISSWAYPDASSIEMAIRPVGNDLNITNVSVVYDSGRVEWTSASGRVVSAGQPSTFTLSETSSGVLTSGSCASGQVNIEYTVQGSGVSGVATGSGSLTGPVP